MRGPRYWLIALALVLVTLLAACAAPANPAPAPERPTPTTPTPQAPAPTAPSSLYEAAKKEGEIVLWAHSLQQGEGLINAFQDKYPGVKVKVWDAQTPELVAKLLEEAKAGRISPDVVTTSDISIGDLKELFVAYEWPATMNWDPIFRPSHNLWRYYARSPKLPVYNTDLVSAAEAPKTLDDIANAKWRGRTLNSLSNDQMPLIFAYLWRDGDNLNWDKSFAFWQKVVDNTKPRFERGFEGSIARLAAGEFAIHQVSSLNTYFRYKWRGAPVAIAPWVDVPSTMWAVAVTKNGPHPNAGKLFADFFTSAEGQVIFANGQGVLASSPGAAKLARTNLEVETLGLKVFVAPPELYTAEVIRKSQDFWNKLAGIRS
jgi:iron(III) transport system substrate-binding protein